MKLFSSSPNASASSSSVVLVASTSSVKIWGTGPLTRPRPLNMSVATGQAWRLTTAISSWRRMGLDSTVAAGAGRH
jgi:hypothetical protein